MNKKTTATIEQLYVTEAEAQKKRLDDAKKSFCEYFGTKDNGGFRLFSAPGRTEVGGNHTDHNHGKVLAASVNLDIIAVVEPTDDGIITVKSEGYDELKVNVSEKAPVDSEKNTSMALVRGVVNGFDKDGLKVGGFRAYTTTTVMKGSGLSSSAAFEVLVGTVLSHLYNDDTVSAVKIAQIAQYAENVYFGKPSGLMDQMASSVGGFVAIDFKDTSSPIIENINVDFSTFNHTLCIVDTKGDHADLTDEYAAIPREMKEVAEFLCCKTLRELCRKDITLNMALLREKFGDRAVLRALHFFEENERVDRLAHALKKGDFEAFLGSVNESGNSSYKYLQNVFAVCDIKNQSLGIALNVAENVLKRKGACRVHGGGFAGTIQAFVPNEMLKEFKMNIEKIFGAESCHILQIRQYGGVEIVEEQI